MKSVLHIHCESWPIDGSFTISRGSKTSAQVVRVEMRSDDHIGHAECVPYQRYNETIESVCAQIEAVRSEVEDGMSRIELQSALPAGAARNAVDCCLWDLEAKVSGVPAHKTAGHAFLGARETCFTLSLDTPDNMAAQARHHSERHLLKLKMGTDDDKARIHAVRTAAPNSKLIIDANEGWSSDNIRDYLTYCSANQVSLIEQPLPANDDEILAHIPHPVPICADESAHTSEELHELANRYDCINIKLDKTGGLTEALIMEAEARKLGFSIMVGCMVGTSLAMAPAMILAQGADYVDLDGPLLLQKDRNPSLAYTVNTVGHAPLSLWG